MDEAEEFEKDQKVTELGLKASVDGQGPGLKVTLRDGSGAIVGVVGALQLDVLAERLQAEYGLPVTYEQSRFEVCRWISADDPADLDKFQRAFPSSIASDLDEAPVYLAQSAWALRYEQEKWPQIRFTDVKDYQKKA